jgi:myo-inositol-1(or 4)-monophosphatase
VNSCPTKIVPLLREVGALLKDRFNQNYLHSINDKKTRAKSHRELVIEEDLMSEEMILSGLKAFYPNIKVFSEEMKNWPEFKKTKEHKFLVDPLDGTHNFYFGIPLWGISISLLDKDNAPLFGAIYLPMSDLLVTSTLGEPFRTTLYQSDQQVLVDELPSSDVSKSLILYDNQFYRLEKEALKNFGAISKFAFTTRITGSAAFDAAMIVLGRVQARIWHDVAPYDVAAAIPLIRGVGGIAGDFDGNRTSDIFTGKVILCSNEDLYVKLVNLLEK